MPSKILPTIGIIGGSGVYEMDGVRVLDERKIPTPFGDPSDAIVIAEVDGRPVAFLPRHGKGHRILPTELPVKANLWALKSLGVRNVISISAVGSLREEFAPRHFVVPDQIIDRTKARSQTFFGEGVVGHVSFADPFCEALSGRIHQAIAATGSVKAHRGSTYLCMEGPQFSTRAESRMYRSLGCGIIGMTAIPEAKLAREAELAYSMIAMVTDYDCWKEDEQAVSVEHVIGHMKANVATVRGCLPAILAAIPDDFASPAHEAAKFAIMTPHGMIPETTREKLKLFYGKYWS